MMIRPVTMAALLLLASVAGAAAQAWDTTGVSQPGWSLDRTMREFVRDLGGDLAGYFPARGEWEWVQTTRYPDGTMRRNVHRFPAVQTGQAIEPGGPVCHMFHSGDAVVEGTVISSGRGEGRWRRVGATRYVPPGMTARSPIFVDWRREDGRWVVAAVGEDGEYRTPLLGRNPYEAVRGPRGVPLRLPLADSARLATGVDWHEHNIPIVVAGFRITRYGARQRLKESDLVRWGSLHGVGLYVEAGSDPRRPEVIYVPVDREGFFEAYQNITGTGCETLGPPSPADEPGG